MDATIQRIGLAVVKLVHTPQVSDHLLKMMAPLKQAPAQALAMAAAFIAKAIRDKAQGMTPQMAGPLIGIAIREIAEIAKAAKLFDANDAMQKEAMQIIAQGAKQPSQAQAQGQPAQQPQPTGIVGQAMGA